MLADNTPGMHRDNRFGIVPVAVPQPRSSDNTSVTLWDEITPPARPPMPIPVQHPGYTQHAMERSATNRIHR
ncbi:hypothetical protein [Burkholderia latens]|uniref:hypothetical protein n=1 Tax=Burkholderia latens TaxID=488446 RepID=UPI001FC83483|nr:hypothetical protein [Burkholderia latens]